MRAPRNHLGLVIWCAIAVVWIPASRAAPGSPLPRILVTHRLDGGLATIDCRDGEPAPLVELAAAIAAAPEALALDVGNFFGTSLVSRRAIQADAQAAARMVRATGLKALAVGVGDLAMRRDDLVALATALDHEGLQMVLSNLRCGPEAAALCAAISDADDPPLVLDTPGGPVGFIALVAPAAFAHVAQDRQAQLTLLDPSTVLQEAAARARASGARMIVASYDAVTPRGLDAALQLIDGLAPGGTMHAHDVLVVHRIPEAVALMQTNAGVSVLATRPRAAVIFDPETRTVVPPPQPARAPAAVQAFAAALNQRLCQELLRPLPGGELSAAMSHDDFADLLLDILRQHTRAEVAIINRTAVRARELFPLTKRLGELEVTAALPFDDRLRTGRVPGSVLASLYRSQRGTFYLRGVTEDRGKLLVNGRPLDEKAEYLVVATEFVAAGGAGGLGADAPPLAKIVAANPRDLMLRWLARAAPDGGPRPPIDPAARPRWTLRWALDASYAATRLSNAPGYTDAQLARAASVSLRGDLELGAYRDHPRFLTEHTLRLRYGVTRTQTAESDSGFRENADLIAQRTTVIDRLPGHRASPYVPMPYVEGYLESEFTRPTSRAFHHLEVRASAGVRVSVGSRLQLHLGGALDWELLQPGSLPVLAMVGGWTLPPTRLFTFRRRPVEAQSTLDIAWRDPGGASDLLLRFGAKVAFPLLATLSLTVGYDLFVRQVGAGGAGVASDVTVGLRVTQRRIVQSFGR